MRWVVLAVLLFASVARADAPRRAIVMGPIEPALLARVRGQTADLPWSLDVLDTPHDTSTFERALELGRERDAEVVVWVDSDGDARIVHVVEVLERRLFARRLEAAPGEALGTSAIAEAAALVVRSALADLAIGGHVGVVVQPAPPEVPPEEPVAPAPPSPEPAHLRASIDAAIAIDGTPGRAHLGPAVRVAVDVGILELGVEGRFAASEPLDAADVSITITRYALRAGAALELLDLPEWRATLGLAIGVVAHDRSTDARDTALIATTPSTLATFSVSADARLAWTPIADGAVGFELALGADVLPIAPRWTVERSTGTDVVASPWPVQPTVALGLAIRAP